MSDVHRNRCLFRTEGDLRLKDLSTAKFTRLTGDNPYSIVSSKADGGVVNVPNHGVWNPEEGRTIEQKGLPPNIKLESDPNASVLGKDPQLDKAMEYLLDELKQNLAKRPLDPFCAAPCKRKGGKL